MRARFVCMANGPLQPAEAARHPGHRDVQGPHLPHQPLGLRLHRRRLERRPDGAARQARRHHRHRRDGGAVRAAPRRGGRAPLRLPAHAVVDRRARATGPTDPEWAQRLAARLAAAADGQLQHPRLGRLSRRRTWSATAGRTSSASCCVMAQEHGRRASRPSGVAKTIELADFEKMEQIRARVDAIVEGPGDRRGAEALLPPVLQAPVLPRRVPRDLQPPERDAGRHARAGRRARSPRRASSRTAKSTRSTA